MNGNPTARSDATGLFVVDPIGRIVALQLMKCLGAAAASWAAETGINVFKCCRQQPCGLEIWKCDFQQCEPDWCPVTQKMIASCLLNLLNPTPFPFPIGSDPISRWAYEKYVRALLDAFYPCNPAAPWRTGVVR